MLGKVNWLARAAGFTWIGVVAFVLQPPRAGYPLWAAAVGYAVAGSSLLGWALLETRAGARRRDRGLPLVLAALAVGAGVGSAAGAGAIAMVTFSVIAAMIAGAELTAMGALGVVAAGVLGTEVSGLVAGASYPMLLGLPVFFLAGLLIGRNRGAYRVQAEQAATLLAQREQLAAEQRRADLLDERARIAREIHDVLAHSLGALGIQIQAARAVLDDTADVAKAAELLVTAQQLAAEGLVETRRAVHALRTDPPSLGEELARVSDSYAQRYQVAVDFDTSGSPVPLSPDSGLALVRITQEALVNAAKHAPGQRVAVRLDYAEHRVRLTVDNELPAGSDRGPGLETLDGGYGLTGMRERLALLHGTLEAGTRDGRWTVIAELPRPGTMAR